MLYFKPWFTTLCLVTIPVSTRATEGYLRNVGALEQQADININMDINMEDEKFWERQLQGLVSTAPPTTRPPTPGPPTTNPPTTLPPQNGQVPTLPPITRPPVTIPTRPPVTIPTRPPATTPTPATPEPTPSQPETRPPSDVVCDGITQLERSRQLTAIALETSGTIPPDSPQDRALTWLIQTDPYVVCPDDPKAKQRYILAVFYFTTNGDEWTQCSAPKNINDSRSIDEANANCTVTTTPIPGGSQNPSFLPTTEGTMAWLTPVYECMWAGITCRVDTNCVDRIEFENNGVGGTLPIEVRDLPDLRFLILERGTTSGQIPIEFADIEDLLFLDLDFNQLTGIIPEEIYTLTGLFQLDLNDNFLTGTLSPSVGDLTDLVFLQVSGNQLEGPIPDELGLLTGLLTGSFENNDLTGEIPAELCQALTQKPAYILITDCSPEGRQPPKVKCDCCTDCYPEG